MTFSPLPAPGQAIEHPPGRLVPVEGSELWIEEEGEGPTLLLLAGGPANSHLTFHPYFSALGDAYRVVYVDYRGRGRSAAAEDYAQITFRGDVLDIAALIAHIGGPVDVYGFSYGGMVAQALALDHPEIVRRLILANTLHSPEMWQRNHENINRELANQYPEVWEQIVALRGQGVPSSDPRMRELYGVHSRLIRFYNPGHADRLLDEPGARNAELYEAFVGPDIEFFIGGQLPSIPDFRPRLHELKMPVLIMAGRYDRALYPAYQIEFARLAPTADFIMMEKSGSFSHIEEPEAVLAAVRRFLSEGD